MTATVSLVASVSAADFAPDFARLRDHLESLAGPPTRVVVVHSLEPWSEPIITEPLRWLELFALPTIAAFDGQLAGPALDLALACDVRVASEDATVRARNVGTRRLLTLLGPIASVDLFGRRGALDARAMLDCGLVSDLAPPGGALRAALALAATIAARGPIATRVAKEAVWRGLELPFAHALRFETDLTLLLQTTKDRAEGVRAFLEKREPTFTGE